jgi:hypothetical protein
MNPHSLRSIALVIIAAGTFSAAARADEPHGTQTLPAPTPAGTPGTSTIVAPPGSEGVTVVAPTPDGGSVTAVGCRLVTVRGTPTYVLADGSPCPQYAPYSPYSQESPAPQRSYIDSRTRYARDTDRSAALIASAVTFGVGGAATGIAYLIKSSEACGVYDSSSGIDDCSHPSAVSEYVMYSAVMTITPSIPRFVVGDTTRALIYSGIRGASLLTAGLVNWGSSDTSWEGPFLLGFALPVTLGIIDLATTPHREDLEPRPQTAGIKGIAPVALADQNGAHGAMIAVSGLF